jgi:hypothetical protein
LGIDAPGPIRYYYDWPGRYKPFAHQIETADFATLNSRCFILNGMGCIAGDDRVRVSRKGKSFEIPLRDLYKKFAALPDKNTWKARSLKGDQFGMHELIDVLFKGVKPTLRITLEDGKTFRCTADHRIARPDGSWTQAGDLRVEDDLVTNGVASYVCLACGALRLLKQPPKKTSTCRQCKHARHRQLMSHANNPQFKGTPFVDKDGYVRVWAPTHHRANNSGRVYEHILAAEAAFGIPVTREFHVHHLNGVKSDNRPENLEVLPVREHHLKHQPRLKLDGSISAKGGAVVVLPKSSKISSITDGGLVDVYDLCMANPHHNFVVNGVVVHNSGKTLSALWAFDFLRKFKCINGSMLVISPLSTLERTWADEVFKHFPHLNVAVLHGTAAKRLALLEQGADVYVINHDGIKSEPILNALTAKVKGGDIGVVVPDELAAFRNQQTDRWKALNRICQHAPFVWGMTGTPIPNDPTDAYAQIKLINPRNAPKHYGMFRDATMRQITQYKWVARDGALEYVHSVMQPAVRFSREDCIDLPPTTYVTHHAEFTPEQARTYKEMFTKLRTEHDSAQLTAVSEATAQIKLLQICVGVAYGDSGEVEIAAKPRVDLVRELIEEAQGKVIVFVPFRGALGYMNRELSKHFTTRMIYGGTPKSERDETFSDFMRRKDPRVLVAQPATMSHGLTLTAASTIIWVAPITSAETYEQANARIVRPGQVRNTLIVHIEGCDLERRMYDRLRKRTQTQGLLLEMFKEG